MCGWLKDQSINIYKSIITLIIVRRAHWYELFGQKQSSVSIECMNVLYEWNENHKISDQRLLCLLACEKLGQVHVMMFVLGENLGLMRFAAAEQQPRTSHLLPTLLSRPQVEQVTGTADLKNTNIIFSFWNFCIVLIYLTQFFKEHAMFVFIGGAARGRLQLPLIFLEKS